LKPKQKNKEEQTEDSQEGQSDFQQFISSALRQPRGGIYEHLLSQFLAQAVIVTDPLKRIKIVTEACLTVREPERENLAINYEKVRVLNLVVNAMLNPSISKLQQGVERVFIPWGFPQTEENFKTFILPWLTCKPYFWSALLVKHFEEWKIWKCQGCDQELARTKLPYPEEVHIPAECPKCKKPTAMPHYGFDRTEKQVVRKIIEDPSWSFFFEICNFLTPEGYNLLRNNFVAWAVPKVQLYLAELTQMVSPGLYESVLGLYTRDSKRSYAEKVKEVAKPPEAPADET
jgi:hypothetical protein